MTRSVTSHLFSSVNGVSEAPNTFQFDAFGQAEGEAMGRALHGVTDVIIGANLWREWSEYWPTADDPFGHFINPARKHVISSTLTAGDDGELGWNSVLVDGDPVAYIEKLRQGEGGGITVTGGVETVRRLFLAGVIDTLTLTMHPAVTGQGRRLFDDSVPITRLNLVDSRITPAGNAMLTYSLRPAD